jgi:hypothetical protein
MSNKAQQLLDEINSLRCELEAELEKRRERLGWRVHDGLVSFEQDIAFEHEKLRVGIGHFLARSNLATVVTAPVIYSLLVPFALIDIWTSFYQAICFRAYRIPRVSRSEHIRFDRRKLRYLNRIEALNCTYCSYANGVIDYVREVASRTEQYWCPIKHALRVSDPHPRYNDFVEYGDAERYRATLERLREALREEAPERGSAAPR